MADELLNREFMRSGKTLDDILQLIEEGNSVRSIAKRVGCDESYLRRWLFNEENAPHSMRARDTGCDSIAEQVIEISDNLDIDPQHKRVMVDSRLRLLGKWSQRYGDKQQIEHSGHIEGLTDAQVDARLTKLLNKQKAE
jgi:hypothetical protein